MAAVAEQPPPPCFFSLSLSPSLPRPLPTPPPPDLLAASLHSLPPSVTVPTNRFSYSPLYALRWTRWNSPPRPTQLTPFHSHSLATRFSLLTYIFLLFLSRSPQVCSPSLAHEMLFSSDPCILYIRLPVSSPHPLPASHLGVCVGRNQGQECSRPTTAPHAIDSVANFFVAWRNEGEKDSKLVIRIIVSPT